MQVVGLGAVAACSLLPYANVIREASQWNSLVRIDNYTSEWFWLKLYETLLPAGPWILIAWMCLAAAGVILGVAAIARVGSREADPGKRDVILFALVSLIVGACGEYVFLRALSYYTQPWY